MKQEHINMVDPKIVDTLGFLNRLGIKKVKSELEPDNNGISKVYVTFPSINDFEVEGNYPYKEFVDVNNFDLTDKHERAGFASEILKEFLTDIFYGLAEDIMTDVRAQKPLYRAITKRTIKVLYKIREEEWTVEKSIERADDIMATAFRIDATSTFIRLKNRQQ